MIALPTCRYRGPRSDGNYECSSPFLFVPASGVSGEFCLSKCPYIDRSPAIEDEADLLRIREAVKRPSRTAMLSISLADQTQTFLSEMAKWIAAGRPRVSPEQQAERRAICDACEHKKVEEGRERCGLCGCYLRATSWLFGTVETPGKLELATVACPAGKWPALYPPPEKQI